ncbi:hypothetical protein [Geodermatophilus sp. URMC 60]
MTTKRSTHGPAGERLVAAVLAELARDELEPDVREAERLHQAADLTDRLEAIREQLAREGLTTPTATGGAKPHPLLAAERATVAAISRLLDGIALEAASIKDSTKQRATRTRWRTHNQARRGTT